MGESLLLFLPIMGDNNIQRTYKEQRREEIRHF
jgi:hypothetical protein